MNISAQNDFYNLIDWISDEFLLIYEFKDNEILFYHYDYNIEEEIFKEIFFSFKLIKDKCYDFQSYYLRESPTESKYIDYLLDLHLIIKKYYNPIISKKKRLSK